MLWIVLIVLLAVAGGFLGTLLEFALWAVVLTVLGAVVLGVILWRAVAGGSRSVDGAGGNRSVDRAGR